MNPSLLLPPGAGAPTMPGGAPGAVGTPVPPNLPQMPQVHDLPPGAIPGGPAPFLPPGAGAPPEYAAVTQADGSVLLHRKNPDGSLGPAVKIITMGGPKKPAGPM